MSFHIPVLNIVAYIVLLLAVAAAIGCMSRRLWSLPLCCRGGKGRFLQEGEGKWAVLLFAAVVAGGVSLFLLLSTAWTQGDDWRNIFCRGSALSSRIPNALDYYFGFVSRVGDIFIWLFGQSFARTETNAITALLAVAAPFAFFRLCRPAGVSIFSARGIAFYVFTFFLCLVGVCLTPWRNYRCWAAVINYLVPTLATVFFLSCYRIDSLSGKDSKVRCLCLFVLGVFCGWGTECCSVLLIPGLTAYALYCRRRNIAWATSRLFGWVGTWLGATLLFASPALANRSNAAREFVSANIAWLSPQQVQDFLSNLGWDSLNLLRGVGGVIFLGDFPFLAKLHFLPFLLECYWGQCAPIGIVCLVVLTISGLLLHPAAWRTVAIVPLAGFGLATLMACSYLTSCIPLPMSFLPPCFVIVGTCCYLFLRVGKGVLLPSLFALGLAACSLALLVPAGLEASAYKKYEQALYAEAKRQADSGCMDIVLTYPFGQEPRNFLGLIKATSISDDPADNGWAGQVFRHNIHPDIRSVRRLRKGEKP